MLQYDSINKVLSDNYKSIIYQKKSSIFDGLIYVAISILFFFVSRISAINSSEFWPYLLIIISLGLMIAGSLKILMRKNEFYSTEHGKLIQKSIGFDILDKDKLVSFLEKGQIEQIRKLQRSVAESLVLKVLISGNCKICFTQVEHFQNLEYQPVSQVFQHKYEEALLLKLIK